jgi:hypothetical protein
MSATTYWWQKNYDAAVLEMDSAQLPNRVKDALSIKRLKTLQIQCPNLRAFDYCLCVLVFFLVGFDAVPLMTD